MLWPPTEVSDECRGPRREQTLAREVATAHPSAMMGRLMMMMVAAVVKASHSGITGKGLG